MSEAKIITNCLCPPIPDRRWDWVAYRDGNDEGGPFGYGPTEESAVEDLRRIEAESE